MLGIKKMHILLVREFIGPFIATFFVSLFLFLLQFLWKYIGDLIGKGLEWYLIAEFIFYSAIHLIPMALPLAVLLSSIMTFGNLGENYELVAMKAAGMSLVRIFVPMYVMVFIICGFAFYASNILIPKANLGWGAIFYDIMNKKPAFELKEGVFFKNISGYSIKVGKKHDDNQTIEDIIIYMNNIGRGNNNIILAKKGKMYTTENGKYLMFTLEDGVKYQEMIDNPKYYKSYPANTMFFKTQQMAIDLSELEFKRTSKELFKEDYRMLNVNELTLRIDSLKKLSLNRRKSAYTYYLPYFHFNLDSSKIYNFEESTLKKNFFENLGDIQQLVNKDNNYTESEATPVESETMPASNYINSGNTLKGNESKIIIEILESARQFSRNMETMVESTENEMKYNREITAKYRVEWHKKFTLAISCILLFFIGAPLGAIIRKGGFGWPMVISMLLFIVYFVINVIGEKLAKEEVMPIIIASWMSTFLLFPFALLLTHKASIDAKVFDTDTYEKLFIKLKNKFTKKTAN